MYANCYCNYLIDEGRERVIIVPSSSSGQKQTKYVLTAYYPQVVDM